MALPWRNPQKCKQVACSVVVACFVYPLFFFTVLCCCLFTSLSPFIFLYWCCCYIFVFGAFVYHFKNTISIFITICYYGLIRQDYELVSHTTFTLYISGGTYSLKPTPNDRFFEKLFMAIFIYSQSFFPRNLLRGNRLRNTFCILFCCLARGSNSVFKSNKPTHYLLDHGYLGNLMTNCVGSNTNTFFQQSNVHAIVNVYWSH